MTRVVRGGSRQQALARPPSLALALPLFPPRSCGHYSLWAGLPRVCEGAAPAIRLGPSPWAVAALWLVTVLARGIVRTRGDGMRRIRRGLSGHTLLGTELPVGIAA